jgi:hypothetical protein
MTILPLKRQGFSPLLSWQIPSARARIIMRENPGHIRACRSDVSLGVPYCFDSKLGDADPQ